MNTKQIEQHITALSEALGPDWALERTTFEDDNGTKKPLIICICTRYSFPREKVLQDGMEVVGKLPKDQVLYRLAQAFKDDDGGICYETLHCDGLTEEDAELPVEVLFDSQYKADKFAPGQFRP